MQHPDHDGWWYDNIIFQPRDPQPIETNPTKKLFPGIPPLVTSEDHLIAEREMEIKLLIAHNIVKTVSNIRDHLPKTIHVIRGCGGKDGIPVLYASVFSMQEKGEDDLTILLEFEGLDNQMIINNNSIHTIYYLCQTFNIGIHPKSVGAFSDLFGNLVLSQIIPIKPCYSSPEFDRNEFMKTYVLGSQLSPKEVNSLFNQDGSKEFLPTDIVGGLSQFNMGEVFHVQTETICRTIRYYANGTPVKDYPEGICRRDP